MKNIFKGLGLGFLALALVVGVGAGSASANLTFGTTSITTDGAFTLGTITSSTVIIGAATTSGTVTIGGTAQTGSTTIRSATVTGTTTTSGVVVSATALTAGTGLYVLGSGATMTANGIVQKIDMGDATVGTGLIITDPAGVLVTTGNLLTLTANAATTAAGLLRINANGLTSGIGEVIASSATAITGAGRLLRVAHTGATSTDGILTEFISSATDETNIVKITSAAMIDGVNLLVEGTTGMTTGSLIKATSSSAAALATNGIISLTSTGNFTSTSAVNGGFVEIKANDTTAGTILNLVGDALTTGIGVQLSNATSAITSGSLLRVTGSGVGTLATNGLVSITHGGIFVSTSNTGVLDVRGSAMVGTATLANFMTTAAGQLTTTVLNVENSGFTDNYTGSMLRIKSPTTTGAARVVDLIADGITSGGTAMKISTAALTTGDGLLIDNGTAATTTGSLLKVTAGGVGAVSSDGIVSFQHSGIYTSSTVGFVNVVASGTTAGTVMSITGAAVAGGTELLITGSAVNTMTAAGSYLRLSDGTTDVFRISTNGHLISAALDAANGEPALTGAGGFTVGLSETGGNAVGTATDTRGQVVFTADADAGTVILTFGVAYTTAPVCVISPADAEAQANVDFAFVTTAATAMTINYITGSAATSDTWNYICME